MDFSQVKDLVNEHIDLITITAAGLAQATERATKFLIIQSILVSYLKDVDDDIAKVDVAKEAIFADSIRKSDGKTITEKKINVAEDINFSSIKQQREELDSLRSWVKGHIKIFENAHLLYRQNSREN